MNKSAVYKFTEFLIQEYKSKSESLAVIKKINSKKITEKELNNFETYIIQIKNLIREVGIRPELWKVSKEIFKDFNVLSTYLLESNLKAKEYFEVILYLIKRNISTDILSMEMEPICIEQHSIEQHPFKNFTKDEIKEMTPNNIQKLLRKSDRELTLKELAQKYELLEYVQENSINISLLIKNHRTIQEHYLDKLDSFEEEDINLVVRAFIQLKVSPEICASIKRILDKELDKRKKLETSTKEIRFQASSQSNTPKLLTDKEYKSIKKDLNTYYDFYHNQIIRPLSYEEVIYCISQMIRLGESQERIIEFLMKTLDSSKLVTPDSKTWFQEEINRFKFYQDKYSLQEKITTLEQCYEEMQLAVTTGNQADYLFWKNTLLEEYHKLQQPISRDYTYEIHLAKKRTKKEEEKD